MSNNIDDLLIVLGDSVIEEQSNDLSPEEKRLIDQMINQ